MPVTWVECPSCGEPDCPQKNQVIFCLNENCSTNRLDSIIGKNIALSGTFRQTQWWMERLIKEAGGTIKKSVSNKVAYLVLGTGTGYKSNKEIAAQRLNIPIISEEELREMIENQ